MTAIPSSNGSMLFVSEEEFDGIKVQIFNSPIGYVIPFKFFDRYTDKCSQRISDTQAIATEATVAFQQAIRDFNDNHDYHQRNYTKNLQSAEGSLVLWQIATTIMIIVAIALGIALIAVLI